MDLAVDQLSGDLVDWAEAVAISVPMHTAMRLAVGVAAEIRGRRPDLPMALYGLYAGVGRERTLGTVDALFEGEYEPGLLRWVAELPSAGGTGGVHRHLGRSEFEVPMRTSLAGLERYAKLEHGGTTTLAGAVEASHGCRHRCRHCPIPAVYDGRIRVVPREVVLQDIEQLVAAGAGHVTFADADFLNAPRHSLEVLREAHRRHPGLTYDVTVKVEHIIDHESAWPELAELGLLFVVSAFETVDPATLEVLDKGHTVDDMVRSLEVLRGVGIDVRPTWLPFFPWTEPGHVADIFRFLDSHDLVGATDPVQMAIRLLIPGGSLLEDHPKVVPHLTGYDPDALTWRWRFAHGEAELLHKELDAIAANASDCGRDTVSTLGTMREVVARRAAADLGEMRVGGIAPRLTESWFCCSEPTESQAIAIRIGSSGEPD